MSVRGYRREDLSNQRGVCLLLRARKSPKGVSAAAWRRFQAFLRDADAEALAEFIDQFEWSVGAPGSEARSAQIQKKLLQQARATSYEEANAIGERLFVYVFRLLSQRGLKTLTLADLERTLNHPTLPAADRLLLRTVAMVLGEVEARVGSVERALPELRDRLDSLARQKGIEAAVEYTIATPDLEPQRGRAPAGAEVRMSS